MSPEAPMVTFVQRCVIEALRLNAEREHLSDCPVGKGDGACRCGKESAQYALPIFEADVAAPVLASSDAAGGAR